MTWLRVGLSEGFGLSRYEITFTRKTSEVGRVLRRNIITSNLRLEIEKFHIKKFSHVVYIYEVIWKFFYRITHHDHHTWDETKNWKFNFPCLLLLEFPTSSSEPPQKANNNVQASNRENYIQKIIGFDLTLHLFGFLKFLHLVHKSQALERSKISNLVYIFI